MGLITRQIGPDAKGSKLTFVEMDENLYYLQSLGVSGLTFSNNTLSLINPTGGTLTVSINAGSTFTGGTVTGSTNFTNGLTANTLSATTYQNLPTDIRVTGGTYSAGTITFINNTGGTFNVTGITKTLNNEWLIASGTTVEIESFTQKFLYGDLYVSGLLQLNENSQLVILNGDLILSGGTISGSGQTTLVDLPTVNDLISSGTYSAGTLTLSTLNGSDVFISGFYTGTTQFTNGLTANTISATTYQNLPQDIFVTGGTYTNGEILFRNNAGSYFTVTGLPIGGAGGEVYYLNLSQSQPPYQEFSPIGTNLTEQTTGVTINSGVTSTIASFLTPTGYPNTTTIPAGVWSFYLHSYKDVINASFEVFCEVYVYTTGGTETLILTTAPAEVTTYSPTVSMELTDGYYSGSTIDITDKILVKVRTTNTGSQTNTITFFTEGQQNYSYGITPFSNFNALTCETLSGCTTIVNLENNKVNKGGDTMSGTLNAPTISATTLQTSNSYIESTGYLYFGDDNTNGSWRMRISGSNFIVEKRVGGVWIISGTFN
jgi:hypothetical protein